MSDYPALVDALVRPRLAALTASDPEAGTQLTSELLGSSEAFQRCLPDIGHGFLVSRIGTHGSWVWGVGNAHHRSFATLAVGRPEADGTVAVGFDVADGEEEHPAPWRWDFLTLLASVALVKPGQKGSAFAALMNRALDGYLAALQSAQEVPTEPGDLPPTLVAMMQRSAGPVAAESHLSRHVLVDPDQKEPRLRTGSGLSKDLSARAFFLPALTALYDDVSRITVLDVVRRDQLGGPSSGRRGWLGVIRERSQQRSERLRLLDIRERPPSALARVLLTTPFPPLAGPASRLSVTLGGDPYQRLLHGPGSTYAVRSFCHCRQTPDIGDLDETDLLRLARAWGHLLAGFHLRGLRGLRVDATVRAREIAVEATEARKDLSRQAWELAAHLDRAYLAFRKLAKDAPAA